MRPGQTGDEAVQGVVPVGQQRAGPTSRSAALSSTELAGRGAGRGRVELGRGDRLAPGAGSSPAAASDGARRSSYQVVTPWLVTWKMPGQPLGGQHGRRPPARSAVKVGQPRWSSTKRSGPSPPARRSTVLTMLAPCGPHTHDVRTIVGAGIELLLAAELGAPVDRQRVGRVPLEVGHAARCRRRRSRSRCRRGGPRPAGRLGHVPGPEGVDGEGPVGIAPRRRRPPSRPRRG